MVAGTRSEHMAAVSALHESCPSVTTSNIAAYVGLLVQEWLTITQLPRTLRSLVDECQELGRPLPSMEKWVEMTQLLDITAECARGDNATGQTALLEGLVRRSLAAQRQRQVQQQSQQPPLVMASTRPLTGASHHPLKFAHKRALPIKSGTHALSTSTLPLTTKSMRPKSAAVCHSTPDLIARTTPSLRTPTQQQSPLKDHSPASGVQFAYNPSSDSDSIPGFRTCHSERPLVTSAKMTDIHEKRKPSSSSATRAISATSELPLRRDSGVDADSIKPRKASLSTPSPRKSSLSSTMHLGSPVGSTRRLSSTAKMTAHSPSTRALINGIKSSGSPLDILTSDGELTRGGAHDIVGGCDGVEGGEDNGEGNKEDVVVEEQPQEIEDMSERRLTEHFSAFSKGTIKKLRRVLAKSNAQEQEMQRCRHAIDKIQHKMRRQETRSVFAAKQTELLSNTMDMLTKEPCALCHHVFYKKNLTTKVSFKSICDLRTYWSEKAREEEERKKRRDAPNDDEQASSCGNAQNNNDELNQNSDQDDDPAHTTTPEKLDSSQISHLYDQVPVCVFCAQFVLDFASYRPSSAERLRIKEQRRQDIAEELRARDAQRQHDRQRCDPMDNDSLLLNSDDEDGPGTVDEVIVYNTENRPRVLRLRADPQGNGRTPAQLGLVSKRLHYDQLRGRSDRALNRKEWDLIVNGPD